MYQLISEVVRVDGGTGVTNSWSYDAAGNVKTASGEFGQGTATVNADNELTTWTQTVNQVTVTGQVDPGTASNKWFASTASARGYSAPVSMQDGSFGIAGVPVNAGANALTAIVQDVSGNTATQIVYFTVGNSQSSTFSYDENGNLSSSGIGVSPVFSYLYDAENRLVRAVSNSVVVLECWYDGAGHRIAKREIIGGQTNTWQYVWDGWNLVAVLGEDGSLKEFYSRGSGIAGDIGSLVAATYYADGLPSTTYYSHNNYRGDVILARQGTNIVAALDYAPYGELRGRTGLYQPRFRLSSKEYDASTSFYHFPYRYYTPTWGRWITRDPIGEKGGHNLYTYVRNNVTNRKDPSGLFGPMPDPLAGLPLAKCFKGLLEAYITTKTSSGPMAHCVTACKLAKACGTAISDLAGIFKEAVIDMPYYFFAGGVGISPDELSDTLDDLDDNESGRSCANDCGGCEDCCKSANLHGT